MENIYSEYALVESQIAALELKKAQLRPHILKSMIDNKEKSKDIGVGKFSVAILKKWSFPESVTSEIKGFDNKIKTIKDEIKYVQEKAISTNEAVCEEIPSLKFTPVKL